MKRVTVTLPDGLKEEIGLARNLCLLVIQTNNWFKCSPQNTRVDGCRGKDEKPGCLLRDNDAFSSDRLKFEGFTINFEQIG